MSTKIHSKCPREFTQKMSTKIHPKRGLLVDKSVHEMSPKVSTRCHPFCPREVTNYVHEMSATLTGSSFWLFSGVPTNNQVAVGQLAPLEPERTNSLADCRMLAWQSTSLVLFHEDFFSYKVCHFSFETAV